MNQKNQASLRSPKVYNPAPEAKETSKLSKYILFILIIIVIAGGLIYLLYYSSVFNIKNIEFQGNELPEVKKNLLGKNILFINSKTIKNSIMENNPNVGEIKIVRGIPNTLKITITEYEPKLIWQVAGKKYVVNQDGKIYRELNEEINAPIVIDAKDVPAEINQQVVTKNFIEFINTFSEKIVNDLNIKIIYYEVESTIFQVNAHTNQGWFLKLDTTLSANNQLQALKELLKDHRNEINEYADLRVEGKVYYK